MPLSNPAIYTSYLNISSVSPSPACDFEVVEQIIRHIVINNDRFDQTQTRGFF